MQSINRLGLLPKDNRTILIKQGVFWIIAVIAVFFIVWQFPYTNDDYYYAYGGGQRYIENNGMLNAVKWQYTTLNGRILGNSMGLLLTPHRFMSSLVMAVIICGIAFLCSRYLSGWSTVGGAVAVLLTFAMPQDMFREVYAWRSGFFNYVPGMLLLLLYFVLIRNLFAGDRVKDSVWRVTVSLLLGILIQLFVENFTVSVVIMSLVLIVWHFFQSRKKFSWSTVSFGAGSLIGAFIMFSSPRYSSIADGEDSYRTFALNLENIHRNYAEISKWGISRNTLLLLLTCVLGLVLLYQHQKRDKSRFVRLRMFNSLCFGVVPFYFIIMDQMLTSAQFSVAVSNKAWLIDILMLVLLAASLLTTGFFLVENKRSRNQMLFFFIFAAVAAGPLLIINPLSPRTLYFTYVLWALAVLSMMSGVRHQEKFSLGILRAPAVCLTAFVLCAHGYVYYQNMKAATLRDAYIEQKMEEKETTIKVPQYPYSDWIHTPLNGLGMQYYYDKENDIQFERIEYGKWRDITKDGR